MAIKYEVQTYMFCGGWENCWMTTDYAGKTTLEYYDTYEEATKAIDEFLEDIHQAVLDGDIEDDYDPDDYRVMEVEV